MNYRHLLTGVYTSFKGSKSTMDTLIVGTVMLMLTIIVVAIVYIMRSMRTSRSQQIALVTSPIDLSEKKSLPKLISGKDIPIVTLGKSFSFSFWLFLSDGYKATNDHKRILSRGVGSSTNPLVFLHKSTNKLYIAIATNQVIRNDISLDEILEVDQDGFYTSGYLVSQVGYVPMQRWVSFVVSIQDDTIMIFVDADLYSVSNVTDVSTQQGSQNATQDVAQISNTSSRPIIRGTAGDISVGDVRNSCAGFLTKLVYNNFALNANSINLLYSSGPGQPNILGAIGMPSYSLRYPVYKI